MTNLVNTQKQYLTVVSVAICLETPTFNSMLCNPFEFQVHSKTQQQFWPKLAPFHSIFVTADIKKINVSKKNTNFG